MKIEEEDVTQLKEEIEQLLDLASFITTKLFEKAVQLKKYYEENSFYVKDEVLLDTLKSIFMRLFEEYLERWRSEENEAETKIITSTR